MCVCLCFFTGGLYTQTHIKEMCIGCCVEAWVRRITASRALRGESEGARLASAYAAESNEPPPPYQA